MKQPQYELLLGKIQKTYSNSDIYSLKILDTKNERTGYLCSL